MRPTWGQLRQFCAAQGYQETRTDHFHYVKVVGSRQTSGTMVSFGKDAEVIPPQFWAKVWKRQLKLQSEEAFWKGLRGEAVEYDVPAGPEPTRPLPAYLSHFLRNTLHWTDEQVEGVTRAAAQELLNEHYVRDLREADPRA